MSHNPSLRKVMSLLRWSLPCEWAHDQLERVVARDNIIQVRENIVQPVCVMNQHSEQLQSPSGRFSSQHVQAFCYPVKGHGK